MAAFRRLCEEYPQYKVCIVKFMPHGYRWCIDGTTIYMVLGSVGRSIEQALAALSRPKLLVLHGGRDPRPPVADEWGARLG